MSPIIDIQRRLRQAGRIRIGEMVVTRSGKKAPTKLEAFRFTSGTRSAIEAIAQLYGGDVSEWAEAPHGTEWQVYTEATALPVVVPPVPIAASQWYELWSGGGCVRRCDGVTDHIAERPCACDPDPEQRECTPHTRLSVILADLQSIGVWRLDTQSWYAATELAGSLDMVELLQGARQVVRGRLILTERQVKRPGQPTKRFVVPGLDLDVDVAAVAGGATAPLTAGPGAPAPAALTPVPLDESAAPSLEEQMAAVDSPVERPRRRTSPPPIQQTGLQPRTAEAAEAGEAPVVMVHNRQLRAIHAAYRDIGITDRGERLQHASRVLKKAVASASTLTDQEADYLIEQLTAERRSAAGAQGS